MPRAVMAGAEAETRKACAQAWQAWALTMLLEHAADAASMTATS